MLCLLEGSIGVSHMLIISTSKYKSWDLVLWCATLLVIGRTSLLLTLCEPMHTTLDSHNTQKHEEFHSQEFNKTI
ncbi:unnamed protein product [Lactuca virosa]|uniref:Uncharacterized protein n=1 Tax=Lactuca virosa TaxID=75947 RepID=A0AAU9P5Z4_9ASTR|nr:unnamed protein product [Lactuca virosa]